MNFRRTCLASACVLAAILSSRAMGQTSQIAATGADANSAISAVLTNLPGDPQQIKMADFEAARKALVQIGPGAMAGLLAIVSDAGGPTSHRCAALEALVELDVRGQHVRAIARLLPEGRLVTMLRTADQNSTRVGVTAQYLARFAVDARDVAALAEALTDERLEVALTAFYWVQAKPARVWAQTLADKLAEMRNRDVFRVTLAHAAYYTRSPALRGAIKNLAGDDSRDDDLRYEAAKVWAEGAEPNQAEEAMALMRRLSPDPEGLTTPGEFEILAAIRPELARRLFARQFEEIRTPPPIVPTDERTPGIPGAPLPFPRGYLGVLKELGTEEQVREVAAAFTYFLKGVAPVLPSHSSEVSYLVEVGWRDAADCVGPLRLGGSGFAGYYVHQQMGLKTDLLAECLKAKKPAEALRAAGYGDLPVAMVLRHRQALVESAERMLDGNNAGAYRDAFRVLCMLAPDRAEARLPGRLPNDMDVFAQHVRPAAVSAKTLALLRKQLADHEKLDQWRLMEVAEALATAGGSAELPLCRQVYGQIDDPDRKLQMVLGLRKADPNWAAGEFATMVRTAASPTMRLEAARRLLAMPVALPAELIAQAQAEVREALEVAGSADRLEMSAMLAVTGEASGTEVFDAFLKGRWRPMANRLGTFYLLANRAASGVEPCAWRSLDMLVRTMRDHPDAVVRAGAIRQASQWAFHARVRGGGGFPIPDLMMDYLRPENDWRVRVAAGQAMKRMLQDVCPEWDYYAFWPADRQREAADSVQRWWKANSGRLAYVPPQRSEVGYGYLTLGK